MTSTAHSRPLPALSPRAARATAGLALLPAVALVGAPPASAHDELLRAVPAADATLTSAPREVSLTFSGALTTGRGIQNLLQVRDAQGSQWQAGEAAVDGSTLSVPLCPGLPSGDYTVAYRVVYSDGHSEEQSQRFTVDDPAAPAAGTAPTGCGVPAAGVPTATTSATSAGTAPASQAPTLASAASSAPASSSAATPAASASSSATAASSDGAGVPGWVWPAGIAGVAVLGAGAWALRRSAASLEHADRGDAERPDRTDG